MPKEIYINVDQHEKRVAILDNKRIEEFYIERLHTTNLVGSIFKGKVESVLPGIGAAFVNIGLEKNGFLYVSDVVQGDGGYEKLFEEEPKEDKKKPEREKKLPPINEILKKGDEVLVQVVKEPIRSKGARLTAHVSIPGRFIVMMPFDQHIGLSKRISDRHERDRIRKILEEMKLPKDMGFIVRTAAGGETKKDIEREISYLTRMWQHIKFRAKKAKPPSLIHQEYDIVLRVVRDIFTGDVARFEVDSPNEFKRISKFLNIYAPELKTRLKLYHDKVPMFDKYDIQKQIDKVYNRIVQLKSGGYLVFDETESLIAIDVNSGKFVGERNLEETAYRTNMEAAEEIPRQLRLRDMGGIIIIDFIDMEYGGHRKSVFNTLEHHLESDKAKTNILSISSIGLVEMTRQRMRQSIEGKSYQKCPYCNGRGSVKSASTVAIELIRKLNQILADPKSKGVFVSVNPEVAKYVISPERNMIRHIERHFRKNIRITEDPSRHIEDIKVDEVGP
jgi:ribonuclease G